MGVIPGAPRRVERESGLERRQPMEEETTERTEKDHRGKPADTQGALYTPHISVTPRR